MTTRQNNLINDAIESINTAREYLDLVMYATDVLPDEEYLKVRDAYNTLCSAVDKL